MLLHTQALHTAESTLWFHPVPAPLLALWYSSTVPSRCAATKAVPALPGTQSSDTQRAAEPEQPSRLRHMEEMGRVLEAGALSCARSDSSTTAAGVTGVAGHAQQARPPAGKHASRARVASGPVAASLPGPWLHFATLQLGYQWLTGFNCSTSF